MLPKYSLSRELVTLTPYLPKGVPELKSRLKGAKLYRDFVSNTYRAYAVKLNLCSNSELIDEKDQLI